MIIQQKDISHITKKFMTVWQKRKVLSIKGFLVQQ